MKSEPEPQALRLNLDTLGLMTKGPLDRSRSKRHLAVVEPDALALANQALRAVRQLRKLERDGKAEPVLRRLLNETLRRLLNETLDALAGR